MSRRGARLAVKRGLDIAVSFALLVVSLPLFLAISLAIVATSRGGPFFRQARAGLHGREFTVLKFRTMTVDPDADDTKRYDRDFTLARVTPVGRILRRLSLDELPQLVNVVRGDMSLVGPRPDVPRHAREYTPTQRRRLDMRPGITGWAQIHGRNEIPWEERIKLDIEYVDRWSLSWDARIMLSTVAVVIAGSGTELPGKAGQGRR